jgi:UDP:flavonoid glycosyltransferase YjiC (YdhE family)
MRVMFSTVSAYGHFLPMAPLARAARAAGHEVVVAAAEVLRDPVEAMGLALLPVGVDDAETDRRLLARQAPDVQPAASSPEQGVVDRFVEVCARAVLDDLDALLGWQPDVIVREEGEFAAPVIAALAGIPFAEHSWGPMRPPEMVRAVAEAIWAICRQHGLEPDAVGEMHGSLYFDICPPTLQFDYAEKVSDRFLLRPIEVGVAPPGRVERWGSDFGGKRVIYLTLGTVKVFNSDVEFFRTAIDAIASIGDVSVVVTVGPSGDPSAVGPVPQHVRVERFVAQEELLPYCSLVINNGGSGSTLGALAHAVPVLAIPSFSPSQGRNADALVRAGCGRRLDRDEVTAERLRAEVLAAFESHRAGDEALTRDRPFVRDGQDVVEVERRMTRRCRRGRSGGATAVDGVCRCVDASTLFVTQR